MTVRKAKPRRPCQKAGERQTLECVGTAQHRKGNACCSLFRGKTAIITDIVRRKRGDSMIGATFMKVDEVAQELGISKSYAYKIVRELNEELKAQGFLTISCRVNKQYFWRGPVTTKKRERD